MCTDAVSSSQMDQWEPALDRMTAAGAVRTGVIGAMYELMGSADHPSFKTCLGLAKRVLS